MRSSAAQVGLSDGDVSLSRASLSLASADRASRAVPFLVLAMALLPRVALLPINENLFGDAVARTELAEKWLRHPHWISSFKDGAYQFGPLHLYLVGLALKLGLAREHAGRAVSFLFGTLSALPLYFLTRRLFGWRAGVWAGFGFSVWGIHLQLSTTAASEALHLFWMLCVFALLARGLEESKFAPLVWAAACLNLACATRYDAWLFIPLLSCLLMFWGRDRIAGVTRGVLFGLLCLPFPLAWMQGNEVDLKDPFYPLHFVEQFHRAWVASEVGTWGRLGFRLESLFFWPASALVTLTAPLAFFGAVGMARAFRRHPSHRWVLWACWIPAAYFTVRSAVWMDFVPLTRFTVVEVALLLPFIEPGYRAVFGRTPWSRSRWPAIGTAAVAVAFPCWLSVLTLSPGGKLSDSLRPISPISLNPPEVTGLARFLKKEVLPSRAAVALDADPSYLDLQVAFFSGLPGQRLYRSRWPEFTEQVSKVPPEYLVLAEGGPLWKQANRSSDHRFVEWSGARFGERDGFLPPFHVYQRVNQ